MQGSTRAVALVTLLMLSSVCDAAPSVGESEEPVATYDQRQKGKSNYHVHIEDIGILAVLDAALLGEYGQYDYSYDYQDPEDPTEEDEDKPDDTTTTECVNSTTALDTSTEASSVNVSTTTAVSSTSNSSTAADVPANSTQSSTTSTTTQATSTTTCVTKKPSTTTTKAPLKPKPKPTPVSITSTSPRPPSIVKPQGGGNVTKEPVGDTKSQLPLLAMLLPIQHQQDSGGVKKHQQSSGRRRCGPGFFRDSRGRCRRHRKPHYNALQGLPLDLPFGLRLSPRPVAEPSQSNN